MQIGLNRSQNNKVSEVFITSDDIQVFDLRRDVPIVESPALILEYLYQSSVDIWVKIGDFPAIELANNLKIHLTKLKINSEVNYES